MSEEQTIAPGTSDTPSSGTGETFAARGQGEQLFFDMAFRQKRKKGKFREVACERLEYPVVDTHAHLDTISHAPLSLARCAFHGIDFITTIVDVFEDAETTYRKLDAWRADAVFLLDDMGHSDYRNSVPTVRIAIGCHPHNAQHYDDALEETLIAHLEDTRTCAIGEIGLDYHYDLSPRADQREAFRRQIRLAHKTGLPVVLHMREAHDEGFEILTQEGFPAAGVLLHCFNLDEQVLTPWVDAGCFIAYGGPLTFKNADEVRQSVWSVPRDRLLTETDSPFMTPEPMRGMECGPEHVIFTAATMARVLGCDPGEERREFLEQIHRNALGLLDRGPTSWQRG